MDEVMALYCTDQSNVIKKGKFFKTIKIIEFEEQIPLQFKAILK